MYASLQNYITHMKVHKGIRDHTCLVEGCLFTSTTKQFMLVHMEKKHRVLRIDIERKVANMIANATTELKSIHEVWTSGFRQEIDWFPKIGEVTKKEESV